MLCGFTGPFHLVVGADLVYDNFPSKALQETVTAALRSSGASAVLALQPRQFPQKSYLSDPRKISNFLRSFADKPGWDVVMDKPAEEAAIQAGIENVKNMVIATIVPENAKGFKERADVQHSLRYSKEDL